MIEGFRSPQEHMESLFDFLDILLYAAFQHKRGADYENLSMRGLVITEKEIDQAFGGLRKTVSMPAEEALEMVELGNLIRKKEKVSTCTLPFYELCRNFALTPLECLALLLGAAPSFHRKYEKIYGYLQDRVDLRMPTRGLCVSLAEFLTEEVGEGGEEFPWEDTGAFLAGGGNLDYLLERVEKPGKGLSEICELKKRVLGYLQGSMEPSPFLRDHSELFIWAQGMEPSVIREEEFQRLLRLWDSLGKEHSEEKRQKKGYMILISGRDGIGKRFLLRRLAVERRLGMLFVDVSKLLYEKDTRRFLNTLEEIFLESMLTRSCLCLRGIDLPEEPEEDAARRRTDRRKEIFSWFGDRTDCFFALAKEAEEQASDYDGRKVCLELPSLSPGERIRLFHAFGADYRLDEEIDLEENGNKYLLTPGGIRNVLDTAELLAAMDGQEAIGRNQISQAVKQNQKNQLGAYATLINSRFVWDDLILGEEQKQQMRMVCNQMKYRDVVGENWGFHKKTPYGRGLSVLFYGPPGTGKTMAAQVMANELGLDLYRIDISQMVSKYIGETQKNISRLFQKARDINAVLFFDEADSLFAKRSEAKDSHDRSANAETAHLLQKLEDYEGITVLATNYLNNIDDAFKRRIKFIIHIAFPEASVRLKLWRSTLPAAAECEEELDFEFFANRFELSGSSIKEILTNAAYLAASEHRGLANCDLVEAVKLNYAKYGKILTREDFDYYG